MNQARVDGGESAKSSVVEQHSPRIFHLPLPEEKRVRRLVFPGLECQVQPTAMGRAALEFLPLGEARRAEVMRAGVDHNRPGGRLAKRGDAAKNRYESQLTHRRRRGCGLAKR